jgi:hypothetical protein
MSDQRVTLQDRKRSLQLAGAGGAVYGAGTYGSHLLGQRLKRYDAPGTYRAIYRSVTHSDKPGFRAHVHVPHVAGKLLSGAAAGVGLPLAAYGVANAVRAKPRRTRKLDVHSDIVEPVLHQATLRDKVNAGAAALRRNKPAQADQVGKGLKPAQLEALGRAAKKPGPLHEYATNRRAAHLFGRSVSLKRPGGRELVAAGRSRAALARSQAAELAKALTEDEKRRLARHRRIGRATALTGGTLGLGALATRAPGGAKLLAHKVPALARIAAHEPAATRLSNTLGVTAIGTGSAGSFNYAAQQKLERKREPMVKAARRDHTASDAAITAAGATTTGIGLVGGGIPGVRGSDALLEGTIHARGVRGAAAHVAAARGGIFGSRAVTHAGYQRKFSGDERYYRAKPANRAQMYERGKTAGKVEPEARIIRHLKRGRAGSVAATLGGAALTGYGVHRLRSSAVRKDRRGSQQYFGALTGAGLTAGTAAHVGSKVLGRQAKKWGEEYQRTTRESRKLVKDPRNLERKVTRSTAYEAGHLRGAAGQAGHFAREYGTAAAGVKAIRNPALTVAALGAAGLGATELHRRKFAKYFTEPVDVVKDEDDVGYRPHHRDRFLRAHYTRLSPEAERGYRTLKGGRNRQAAQTAGGAVMTGLGGWLTQHELRHKPVAKPAAAIAAAGTLASAIGTESSLAGALSYHRKLGKIKAKARSRRAQGLYAPGRGLSPVDTTSARYGKALAGTEVNAGKPYERYSTEQRRRHTAAAAFGYGSTAAAAGAAGTGISGAKFAGTRTGQGLIRSAQLKMTAKHPLHQHLSDLKRAGEFAAKHKKTATAAMLGTSALAAGAGAMHSFRSKEAEGMSTSIGRMKAGETFRTRQTQVAKVSPVMLASMADVNWRHPALRQAYKLARAHSGKLALGTGTVGTGAGIAAGARMTHNRRREAVALRAASGGGR